ncbi:FecR family protein [Flavivirga spongiicola]|uniref:DUF4974 domain-containing protein n=1 Tax=Flavivirga spongiicola TaxID=421621 RepID=A0ABU7XRH8_9FLAO|nr:FecR domain-containing protein [Flavivirga sp. MEBiC05379]MDO5978372.1 DUF4974 domain-containing protein [Flavivirga sp. MEBiC05379]
MKKLILKYLTNTITDAEQDKLSKWLSDSENQKIFEAHIKNDYYLNTIYNEDDLHKAYNDIWDNILKQEKDVKRLRTTPWLKYKYIAAASIALLISLTFIFNKDNTQISEPIIVNNNIKAGTDKATLTLDNGSVVALEKGQIYTSDNLESNGEKIIYKPVNTLKDQIAHNYLTIPRGGHYLLKLSDGTQVWLNSESKLKYPVNFVEGKTRKVELIYGEAYFDVSPSILHSGSKFKVRTNTQDIEVLGTEFNIKAYKDETNTYTTLVEGKVSINNAINTVILSPGEQSITNANDEEIKTVLVDIYDEIAWKDGVFSFKNKPLKDIAKVLSRWYDMDVIFIDKSLEKVRFKGVLGKNQSIEEILSAIKSVSINNYEINNKTIIIK